MTRAGLSASCAVLLAAFGIGAARPADPVYAEALALYRAGDASKAAARLEAGLARDGADEGRLALLGWCRLRIGEPERAHEAFSRARDLAPDAADPWAGLGYVALRRERSDEALVLFERALALAPENADAWKGLGLAQRGRGDLRGAREALGRAAALAPEDTETKDALREITRAPLVERRPRSSADPATPLRVPVRTTSHGFEVDESGRYRPVFVVGVNLSTALPGRFPGEFPDDYALYRAWFDQMGDLGVNTVRLYTLHPPSLYRALAAHNAERPGARLRLVQGVWSELPPGDDFTAPEFLGDLRADVERAIDAVHGNLELPPRPGRAHGVYDTDVSEDVLAFLLGREWEPFSVEAFDRGHSDLRDHPGRYVRAEGARPTETWLAALLDRAMAHETERYRVQHPVAFVSWPTLDPLAHPTESSWDEEQRARGKAGIPAAGQPPFDDDRAQIDPTAIEPGPACAAGLFASYHIYPYHPDFLLLEPGYAPDRYLGYLRAMKARHGSMPVLVAELGLPTSRGVSHLHPEGLHHGGHTEREQGLAVVRMLREVESAGLAGGIVFSWIDEWFKHNWLTRDLESPADRDPLWLNVLDPEESFGLIAARPGHGGPRVVLDGRTDEWASIGPGMRGRGDGALGALRATSDEAYLYLLLEVDRRAIAHEREYWIGINTYDIARGDHRFPEPSGASTPIGLEFLVRLAGRDESRIDVDRPYDPFDADSPRPLRSEENADGIFVPIAPETNRERISRDGTRYPALRHSRSALVRGSTDPTSADRHDLADWYESADGRRIELRLPWALLNVTDPSSRRVAHEDRAQDGPVETVPTDGFRFDVLALDLGPSGVRVVDRLPRVDPRGAGDYPTWNWHPWSEPTYHLVPKDSYFLLQRERRVAPERLKK
jgi:tetratricopeptide (TPR) repeat protein